MEDGRIKVIIKPILNPLFVQSSPPANEIERYVLLDGNVKLCEICKVIMEKIGLEQLHKRSHAYIQFPDARMYDCSTFPPKKKFNVNYIRTLAGKSFNVQILAYGNVEEFNSPSLKEPLYCNILKLLMNNNMLVNDCTKNPVVENLVNVMNNCDVESLPYRTLLNLNKTMEKEAKSSSLITEVSRKVASLSIESNFNTLLAVESESSVTGGSSSHEDRSTLISMSHFKESFCKMQEKPLLDQWFQENKYPTMKECKDYANKLNRITNRPQSFMITGSKVKAWFKKQRTKGNRKSYSCSI